VSQRHIVWSVLCPLNIFPVQADDDGSGGGIASWVASTAALAAPATHESSWVNRGVQIVKKSKSDRDRIVDRKIKSKSIEIDKAES